MVVHAACFLFWFLGRRALGLDPGSLALGFRNSQMILLGAVVLLGLIFLVITVCFAADSGGWGGRTLGLQLLSSLYKMSLCPSTLNPKRTLNPKP